MKCRKIPPGSMWQCQKSLDDWFAEIGKISTFTYPTCKIEEKESILHTGAD